jgi:hypothetical protein
LINELGSKDTIGSRNENSKNNKFLGRMMMGEGMNVSVNIGLFSVNLVGELPIRKSRDKKIQKGERIILFHFHRKLYLGGDVVEMMEKGVEGELTMRPNDESIIKKSEPTLWFEMPGVYG